jgi:hypothetical protein
MIEINRLRQRILNSGSKAREYRMTMDDARALLNEIDSELDRAAKKIVHIAPPPVDPIAAQHVIMDGGSFTYAPGFSPPQGPIQELPTGVLIKPSTPIPDKNLNVKPIGLSQG